MQKIFFYGTLKKGFFNYARFDLDKNAKFLGTGVLHSYKMYNLGSYPYIVKSDGDSVVHGEIYEYTNTDCQEAIKRMEENAGYVEVGIRIGDMLVKTFIFEKKSNGTIVEDGIWK